MTKKKLYSAAISLLTLILAVSVFFAFFRIDTTSIAKQKLKNEAAVLEKNITELNTRIDEIETELEGLEADLSTKETVNDYYMEYKKTYDDLSSEITSLEAELAQVEADLEEKQLQLDTLNGVKTEKEGKKYSLTSGSIYICPSDVPDGRYRAKGNGTIVISTQSGKNVKVEDLDVAYQNSYTFNLEKTQRIKVTGNVTLTELITEKDAE